MSGLLPFAMTVETPPLQTSAWWDYVQAYLQDAGAFALLGLWIWIIASFIRSMSAVGRSNRRGVPLVILAIAALALALYAVGGISSLVHTYVQSKDPQVIAAAQANPEEFIAEGRRKWFNVVLDLGGLFALLGVFLPFLKDSMKLRLRRIFALAKLSFIEAVRRRVLWGFLVIVGLFLFPPKWFLLVKPEDEVRINVTVIHVGANLVLLLAAAALASFSIPTDIRNQTIHTIVTKPVEKFEIVIGRFLGYLALLTSVLIGVFGFALLMLFSSRVDPEAQEESMKARMPVYGNLGFQGPTANFHGESVGREWEYRRYVPGGVASPYRAVWYYFDVEPSLAKRDWVPCEFSFDIFRTSKGEENKSVECTFFVYTHHLAGKDLAAVGKEYQERTKGLTNASPTGTDVQQRNWQAVNQIAGELGYYEFPRKPIADYHTDSIPVPSSLFAKAAEGTPQTASVAGRGQVAGPRVVVSVRCDSSSQFLGVARYDLYLLASEGNFYLNFFKGALGIWMRICIVLGIAVTCSTYLNGVVSFIATAVLAVLGFNRMFVIFMVIQITADVPNPGPADSLRKLVSNESLGAAPDASNPTHKVTAAADSAFRWVMRRVVSMIPDMERLTWRDYVANGFNVPTEDVFWSFMGVGAYLSLWAVLGHYLMKWREVATW